MTILTQKAKNSDQNQTEFVEMSRQWHSIDEIA